MKNHSFTHECCPEWLIRPAPAAELLKKQGSEQKFIELFRKGDVSIELYAPEGLDLQTPHLQDEVYFIISGTGIFNLEGERCPFVPNDLIFVPAGKEHRFENFTEDFQTWVLFFGPKKESLEV